MDEQRQLISELQEDLRAYQMKQLWEKHGSTLIAVCVAAVIGTGIGVVWRDFQASRNATYTGQLIQALAQKDDDAKQKGLEATVKAAGGHAQSAMAHFHLAELDTEGGKSADALEQYRAVVSDKAQDEGVRNLAHVLATDTAADTKEAAPIGEPVKPGAAFYDNWREAEAWRVYAAGDTQNAMARFGALRDDVESPPALRARMQAVTSLLAPETPAAAEKAPEEKAE